MLAEQQGSAARSPRSSLDRSAEASRLGSEGQSDLIELRWIGFIVRTCIGERLTLNFVEDGPMAAPAVRRADFLMALAYATDLATGHSRDFALRSCVLAMRFAEVAGLDEDTRRSVYHQALLRYIGCNADTHLLAAHWGDEITLRRELHHIDMGNRAEFVETLRPRAHAKVCRRAA